MSKKDSVPFFGKLSKFDSNIKDIGTNYFMRSRNDPENAGSGSTYNGYWDSQIAFGAAAGP